MYEGVGDWVLREIFGSKGDEVTGDWRNCFTSGFMICTADRALFG